MKGFILGGFGNALTGQALLDLKKLTDDKTLLYLLVQNFKESLSQACVCFLSSHGHFDSVLYRKGISS